MADIKHKLEIKTDPKIVFEKLTTQSGLSGWWTPDTRGKPEINSSIRFGFGPTYFKEMKVVEQIPEKKVHWKCITGTEEWVGTTVQFDLTKAESKTVLFFSHNNWKAQTQMFSQCSYDWAMFLRSLKKLCETGEGNPYPNQDQ